MMPATLTELSRMVGFCLAYFMVVRCSGQYQNSSISSLNVTDLNAAARTLLEVLPGGTTTGKFGPDAIPVGNYTIIGCSSPGTGSKADYLTTILPTFLDRLQDTIGDAEFGENGFHGYKAFFKSANKDIVEFVFWSAKRGSPLRLKTRRGDKIETPKIICLGDEEDESHVTGIGNLYKYFCSGEVGTYSPVAQFRRSSLVLLCPSFFQLIPWPTMLSCPRLINSGLWPDDARLLQSQYAMLMRILTGLYVPANRLSSYPTSSDIPANLKAVVDLPESAALFSKDSYAYYAACRSRFPFPDRSWKTIDADRS